MWWICPDDPETHPTWRAAISNSTRGNNCPLCKASNGERLISEILTKLKVTYYKEWSHYILPTKRYDFYIHYKEHKILIEYDGIQHFKYVEYFHKSYDDYTSNRNNDILKTTVALKRGFKIVRIDYTNDTKSSIIAHLSKALISEESTYFSNVNMYEWLIDKL